MNYRVAESLDELSNNKATIVAGGTDLQARINEKITKPENILDISNLQKLTEIEKSETELRLGACVTLEELSRSEVINEHYPGLSNVAEQIATPQIRRIGTIGGNLLQRTRCWYFRNPEFTCYKKGGSECFSRAGESNHAVLFETSPCITAHPSTLGMTLLAYDAIVHTANNKSLTLKQLFGDGTDATRDNMLPKDAVLTRITLGEKLEKERYAYYRVKSRTHSEWPLVEGFVRAQVEKKHVKKVFVCAGGISNVPMRLKIVERGLNNKVATSNLINKACDEAIKKAPEQNIKARILKETLKECLEKALL